jgi:hypothetical protein
LAVKDQFYVSSVVALETAIGLIATYRTAEKIPHLCFERGVDWTSDERQQIFVLPHAVQDRTAAKRRENKEDKRKKQGQAAQQQESLLNYQNMIALVDPEEWEAIHAQLQVLLGGDSDFQARPGAPKDQEGDIELGKAYRLIYELILRENTSFRPRRPSARSSSGLKRTRAASMKRRSDGDSTKRKCLQPEENERRRQEDDLRRQEEERSRKKRAVTKRRRSGRRKRTGEDRTRNGEEGKKRRENGETKKNSKHSSPESLRKKYGDGRRKKTSDGKKRKNSAAKTKSAVDSKKKSTARKKSAVTKKKNSDRIRKRTPASNVKKRSRSRKRSNSVLSKKRKNGDNVRSRKAEQQRREQAAQPQRIWQQEEEIHRQDDSRNPFTPL